MAIVWRNKEERVTGRWNVLFLPAPWDMSHETLERCHTSQLKSGKSPAPHIDVDSSLADISSRPVSFHPDDLARVVDPYDAGRRSAEM